MRDRDREWQKKINFPRGPMNESVTGPGLPERCREIGVFEHRCQLPAGHEGYHDWTYRERVPPTGDAPGLHFDLRPVGERPAPPETEQPLLTDEGFEAGHAGKIPVVGSPAPRGPQEEHESFGGLTQLLAHAQRVAAEVRRAHPAPTDGSEDSLEGEAAHVIRRLADTIVAAPVRTGRMDLHDELDRRFPVCDDFAAFVEAPRGPTDAPPLLPDTFVERVVRIAQGMSEPNEDVMVRLSAFEASAIRRGSQEPRPQAET